MKSIKILRNGKNLGVIFAFIFAILILNIALADVSVSSIITDNQTYNAGDVVKIEFNISIVDEVGYCLLDSVNFSITDGNSLSCSLPTDFGIYINRSCGGHNINVTLTQKYYDCYQYGGNNTYYYVIFWQIPNNWNAGKYNIKVSMSAGGKNANNTGYFNVNKILNSNISNSTIIGSYIENSTINDSIVRYSNVSNSNVIGSNVNNSDISGSTLQNNSVMNSNIINSTLPQGAHVINATINNNILAQGTILLATPWGCCKDCKIFNVTVNNSGTYMNDKYVSMGNEVVNITDLGCLCFKACAQYCGCYANISIVKTPNATALSVSGYVTYTYNVTNNGCINLTDLTIKDDKLGTICNIPNLTAEASYSCNATAFLKANTTNEACVYATLQNENAGIFRCTKAEVIVSATPAPGIILSKTASNYSLPAGGGNVTYYYTIKNTGNVPLSNITVSDNKCSLVICPNNYLSVGDSMLCNCTKTLTSTETNIATVTAMFGVTTYRFGTPGISGATVTVNVGTAVTTVSTGGSCTTCGPQQYQGIPVGEVTTTQQISTNISDTTTPGSRCFKIECTTNTYQDGKLTTGITKNVPSAANILLTLSDGSNINASTNANGEICYQFGCGIYTITIPKGVCGNEYSKTITTTYGNLHIEGLSEVKTTQDLIYLIKDDNGNLIKDVFVNVTLPNKTFSYMSSDGTIKFNSDGVSGRFDIKAHKGCYSNATFLGNIFLVKLNILCPKSVYVNETIICNVTDENGTLIKNATIVITLSNGTELTKISDENGKISLPAENAGKINFLATKDFYGSSSAETEVVQKEIITLCPTSCKCGCIEGTAKCKDCPCVFFGLPCWILLLLLVLIALLLFLLLRKKKIYADEESVNKAIKEGQLENISCKYSKIYVSKKIYGQIHGMDIGDKIKNKFEFADLDEKGENYLKECGDEHVARAKQLNVDLLTANDETAKKAEENKVKVKRYEKIQQK